jgi:hypothetical protein
MKRDLARLYLDMTTAEFERAVLAGHLPLPINLAGERWSRAEIDAQLGRLTGSAPPDWRKHCKLY